MTGHLRLSREIQKWEWYDDSHTFRVFIHLLLNANYYASQYHGHTINRGDVVIGLDGLASKLGITVRNVRTALNHLKSTSEVTIKTTNKFSIVTICNFDSWQDLENSNDNQNDNQNDKPLTNDRQTTDKQLTASNKVKEGIEGIEGEEKNIYPLTPKGENGGDGVDDELRQERDALLSTVEEQKKALDKLREEIEKLKKEKESNSERNDYQAIVDCWNEVNGKTLGKVTSLTDKRKKAIKKLLESHGITQETLMTFFRTLPSADRWLYNPQGEHKNWKPDFDWWMANRSGWFTKALEGKVHKENPHVFQSMMSGDGHENDYIPHGKDVWFEESTQSYWTMDNFYYGDIDDGYTKDNRPDGAVITLNNARGDIKWNASTKIWERV